MGKFIKRVCLALITIAFAATVIVASSYAIFTDTVTIKHHLQAGTLSVTLTRKTLVGNTVGADGYLRDYVGEENVDFTDLADKNVFDLDDTLMVPDMYREATMEIANGGNVAFLYWIEILLTTPQQTNDVAFSEQLEISVFTENEGAGMQISDCPLAYSDGKILLGGSENPVGRVALGDKAEFTVKVAFKNYTAGTGQDNNDAAQGRLHFDMTVYAVQATSA